MSSSLEMRDARAARPDPPIEKPVSTRGGQGGDDDFRPLLIVHVILLFGLPSVLIIKALGAAGSPATVVGILLLVLWGYTNLLHGHAGGMVVPKSFRVVLGAYWVSFVLSYVIGMLRPISREEINSSDRGLLVLCSWTGLMLVAAGGLRTRASLDRLLRIIVGAGVALAVLGIVQFSTGLNPAGAIRIPGLELNSTYGGIAERSDFRRIQGTTSHPIEFGVVLVLVLPLALHYAWYAEPARRKRAWLGVVLIGVALPMAVARSAVVGLLVVMLILLAAWPSERRRKVLLCLPFFVVALKLMIPGLLGTIRSLFTNLANDPSTTGRTDDYAALGYYVAQAPLFGRGPSTFIPESYRILDNAYLGILIENGIVGVALFLAVMVVAARTCFRVRAASAGDERTRDLAISLAAALISAIVTFGTFDALGFSMCAGLYFLLVGCAAALYRLSRAGVDDELLSDATMPLRQLVRRDASHPLRARIRSARLLWIAVFTVLLTLGSAGVVRLTMGEQYVALGAELLQIPTGDQANPFASQRTQAATSDLVQRMIMSPKTYDDLRAKYGGDYYTVAAATGGSLAPKTERRGYSNLLFLRAVAGDPETAVALRDAVSRRLSLQLQQIQAEAGAEPQTWIRAQVKGSSTQTISEDGDAKRALVAAAVLSLLISWWAVSAWRERPVRRRPGIRPKSLEEKGLSIQSGT